MVGGVVLSDLKALSLFLSSGSTPCVTLRVLCAEKKGPPFLPVRVKTELTAELILIVYSLELKTGTPNICELQSLLSSLTTSGSQFFFPAFSLLK